ncbi:MAG: gamma-glutamyltransferase [Planctomycetes bacterium]|nr:gamma-glutamyltransferase [Planctomycetota bacterium]MCB9904296.1 gamma-glutamyltransferase [Planctomycetota bacterium]
MGVLFAASCASNGASSKQNGIERGAVASEHPLATAVGLDVLERGGNAADAAVATAFALAVVYPQAGNLGGGGFALWVPAHGAPLALDFREVAPASTLVARYLDDEGSAVPDRSRRGPLSVGVPGTPSGLFRLHQQCGSGRFTFEELVEPAVTLARDGFLVDPWLAVHLRDSVDDPMWNDAARELFYPGGKPLDEGALFKQPALADTLERLGRGGPDAFYTGSIASAIVRELDAVLVPGLEARLGGSVDLADLANYEPRPREPLRGWFLGHEIFSMPPPSSGGIVVQQTLAVLEGLPLEAELTRAEGREPTVRMLHWWIEALRGSFADRAAHMGDPDHVDVPVSELLSPAWIARRRSEIGERARVDVGPWTPPPVESTETTHLSVVDRKGNALSLTTTLNGRFGSGILVRDGGFLLNNELDDFAIQPDAPNMYGLVGSSANLIAPNKRPLSSMTPTVVRSKAGKPELVLGSPGGPRIITSVVQVLLRVLVLEEDLRSAVDAPRLHQQWSPPETWFEAEFGGGFDELTIAGLEARGQPCLLVDRRLGSVQAILVDANGAPTAYSDPRRSGAAGVENVGVAEPARPPLSGAP